ncbi:MAG: hypothetical protein QOG67_3847 [Verrucomicrobiota bacterium]
MFEDLFAERTHLMRSVFEFFKLGRCTSMKASDPAIRNFSSQLSVFSFSHSLPPALLLAIFLLRRRLLVRGAHAARRVVMVWG